MPYTQYSTQYSLNNVCIYLINSTVKLKKKQKNIWTFDNIEPMAAS